MKKIIIILFIILFLTSCSLDRDGFKLFMYGNFLEEDSICVQSRSGFDVDGQIYYEYFAETSYTITNINAYDIEVKISDTNGSRWVTVSDNLVVE